MKGNQPHAATAPAPQRRPVDWDYLAVLADLEAHRLDKKSSWLPSKRTAGHLVLTILFPVCLTKILNSACTTRSRI